MGVDIGFGVSAGLVNVSKTSLIFTPSEVLAVGRRDGCQCQKWVG